MSTVTVKQVIAWLKIQAPGVSFFNSCIDKNLTECVGVYARKNGPEQPKAIGGRSSYGIKAITVLVHWATNSDTCECKALELQELFRAAGSSETIGTTSGYFISLIDPVSVGTDSLGIFEYVFDVNFYYRK
ncbi:MAG TPA: minor capsid protein [Desulfuromonadaceae bacterium]